MSGNFAVIIVIGLMFGYSMSTFIGERYSVETISITEANSDSNNTSAIGNMTENITELLTALIPVTVVFAFMGVLIILISRIEKTFNNHFENTFGLENIKAQDVKKEIEKNKKKERKRVKGKQNELKNLPQFIKVDGVVVTREEYYVLMGLVECGNCHSMIKDNNVCEVCGVMFDESIKVDMGTD